MSDTNLAQLYLKELESEAPATRKCLERIPAEMFDYKPHEKSLNLGYLALLVAEIPRWITNTINPGVIDFATFTHPQIKTTKELVKYFDDNMAGAREALSKVSDEALNEMFVLKNKEQVLMTMPKKGSVSSNLNHWVHHRGQLTVYMRLNNLPVPSIYGPSADDQSF